MQVKVQARAMGHAAAMPWFQGGTGSPSCSRVKGSRCAFPARAGARARVVAAARLRAKVTGEDAAGMFIFDSGQRLRHPEAL